MKSATIWMLLLFRNVIPNNMTGKPHTIDRRETWNTIEKNWIIHNVPICVFACVLIGLILIAWKWTSLPPKIPIWYSRPWGASELGSPVWLFLFPIVGLVCYFINLGISMYLMGEYLIFTQILFLSSMLVNILSLVALIKIVFVIT
jgi:hypothetical protein